jgi:hypothetical protein
MSMWDVELDAGGIILVSCSLLVGGLVLMEPRSASRGVRFQDEHAVRADAGLRSHGLTRVGKDIVEGVAYGRWAVDGCRIAQGERGEAADVEVAAERRKLCRFLSGQS